MAAKNNTELMKKMETATAPVNGGGKQITVSDQIQDYLTRNRDKLAEALPRHVTPERMARIALTTIRMNPKLLECSVPSLLGAIMQAATLGLEPGLLGHAYFVPFNNKKKGPDGKESWVKEVTFIAGYKGLLDLARRSGEIKTIQAQAVHANDLFEYECGLSPVLRHVPKLIGDRGPAVGYYAYALTKDDGTYFEFMTREDIDKIRSRSKAKDFGPWVTDYGQMARKTVLRRLCNYLPLKVEIAQSIAEEAELEFADATKIEMNLGDEPQAIEAAKVATSETKELSTGGSHQALTEADINAFRLGDNLPDTETDEYEQTGTAE